MADQQQVDMPKPEVIRQQMEETRASLAQKLEVLEDKVTSTVQEATEAVSETVENVKETVADTVEAVKDTVEGTVESVKDTVSTTVETVKETFDLAGHVDRHPWAMVGGSVLVGVVGGLLLGPAHRTRNLTSFASTPEPSPVPPEAPQAAWAPASRPAEPHRQEEEPTSRKGPTWWNQLFSVFGSEIDKLKGMAIGTLGGVVRDLVTQSASEHLRPMLTDVINNVTTKLGGQTIQGRVLPETHSQEEAHSTSPSRVS
jgi:ElaB/YqjD/DUF883 family membrane-anchored ribosome-binding protein